ncbi:hypothetical protein KIPB_011663, partial [Kipferlia bialata]
IVSRGSRVRETERADYINRAQKIRHDMQTQIDSFSTSVIPELMEAFCHVPEGHTAMSDMSQTVTSPNISSPEACSDEVRSAVHTALCKFLRHTCSGLIYDTLKPCWDELYQMENAALIQK